jgi:hypothetical protein
MVNEKTATHSGEGSTINSAAGGKMFHRTQGSERYLIIARNATIIPVQGMRACRKGLPFSLLLQ